MESRIYDLTVNDMELGLDNEEPEQQIIESDADDQEFYSGFEEEQEEMQMDENDAPIFDDQVSPNDLLKMPMQNPTNMVMNMEEIEDGNINKYLADLDDKEKQLEDVEDISMASF